MIVHRLAKAAHTGLDGEGARLWGGRWNSPGRAMIYTAASPSLAVLEVLVHLDLPPELAPLDYMLLAIDIPDDAPMEQLVDLPDQPQAAGDDFLTRGAALVLRVPSAVVPQETNALINPRHPQAERLRLAGQEPFRFDRRLF